MLGLAGESLKMEQPVAMMLPALSTLMPKAAADEPRVSRQGVTGGTDTVAEALRVGAVMFSAWEKKAGGWVVKVTLTLV
jgi:hypothetical protein